MGGGIRLPECTVSWADLGRRTVATVRTFPGGEILGEASDPDRDTAIGKAIRAAGRRAAGSGDPRKGDGGPPR